MAECARPIAYAALRGGCRYNPFGVPRVEVAEAELAATECGFSPVGGTGQQPQPWARD